jgi:hypothetical protein
VLWQQRFQRDISLALLPYLHDPDVELRQRAVRAIGRLENPKLLPNLVRLQTAQQRNVFTSEREELTVKLSIARLQSKNATQKVKLNKLLQSAGWNLAEAHSWSKKVAVPSNYLNSSPQAAILREVVDLLYTMGKKKVNIAPLRRGFVFSKAQNVQLACASLTTRQEVARIIDYGTTMDIVRADDEYVGGDHLVSLGREANIALKAKLRAEAAVKRNRSNRNPFATLVRACGKTGDKTFIPLLTRLTRTYASDSRVRYYNDQAIERLERGDSYSFAPQ